MDTAFRASSGEAARNGTRAVAAVVGRRRTRRGRGWPPRRRYSVQQVIGW